MSNADRIEELRTKYEENPRRYFAPLANEHRKAGDLAQAIAICREHLPKQPGHMSGYIVFGQTLFEASNLDEARSVFEQALTLDPENLIALKHLGDIARMIGENDVARRWYARVLDADPRNDDIASQLASLGTPTPAAPMVAVPRHPVYSTPPLEEAVGVFATFDPSSLRDVPQDVTGKSGSNEFWSPPEQRPATHHEPLDLDFPENPEPVAEADFEEGILAPVWPDTTELVARIVTPLRSATPVFVPATRDAVEAFGREASDLVAAAPFDMAPQDQLVEAFLPPEAIPASMVTFESMELETSDSVGEIRADLSGNAALADAQPTVQSELVEFAPSDFEATAFDDGAYEDDPFLAGESHGAGQEFSEPISVATSEPAAGFATVESEFIESDSTENEFAAADVSQPAAVFDESMLTDIDWAEPESVPTSPLEDLSFAADLPFEPEAATEVVPESMADESEPSELTITAEYPIPVHSSSDANSAVETGEFFGEPMAAESEQSFAEISSELQRERETIDLVEAERVASEGVAATDDVAYHIVVDQTHAELEVATGDSADTAPGAQVQPSETERAQPFVTETMAELLVSQGFHSRAIEVYDELVRRRPHDPVLSSRLAELRELEQAEIARVASAQHAPASRYDTPVRNTPLYATPQFSAPLHNTPASVSPLYSTPVSASPIGVPALPDDPSTQSNLSERHGGDRAQAFRTARDRFAELSRRRVARRTPTHATAVAEDASEGLSSLFGTATPATTDELAARALADAFGPVQDSGESLFDPAPAPTPAMAMRSLTPRSNHSVQPPTAVEPRSDRQPSADYSFDKFFPDPAMAGRESQSSPTTTGSSASSAQPVNEDLAQFSAWLKGLNNA